MLIVNVEVPDDPSLPRQFVELVNRLLPPAWRFEITPTPSLQILASDPLSPNAAPQFTRRAGRAALRPPASDAGLFPAWSTRFRDVLRSAVDPAGPAVTISLARRDGNVLVGQFDDTRWRAVAGVIDVADLACLPREAAAAALAHELEEQRQRQRAGLGFQAAHDLASQTEGTIVGGPRVAAEERTTPGGRRAGPWEWWIPYDVPRVGIRVLVIRGNGQDVERSRFLVFPDLAAYRRAAGTQLAAFIPDPAPPR